MNTLKRLLTDAKFVGAVAVVVATIAAVFGVNWTEAGVQDWIAELAGLITALAGGVYAVKRGMDKTTE